MSEPAADRAPGPAASKDGRPAARRVVVILNPAAGRGQGQRRRGEIESLLARQADPSATWHVVETRAPGDATDLAARAAADGADVVAAAGGDGTVGEAANGLVGTRTALAVLPTGTGNDFARTLGVGSDLPMGVRTLFAGAAAPIDLGRAGDRWFVNAAGCGFDAAVAHRINRGYRRLRGVAAYLAAVGECLLRVRPSALRVTVDGEVHEMRAILCAVANTRSYGAGMLVTPEARIDDGLFDLCIVGDVGRIEFLRAFPRVFRGTHTTHPKVVMLRGRHVRLEADPPMPFHVDGEVTGSTPVELQIEPGALMALRPPGVGDAQDRPGGSPNVR